VRVHVGPLPSEGVSEWIAFARGILATRLSDDAPEELRLPDEVAGGFLGFLDEWEAVAQASPTFLWVTDVDPEQIEFLALALYKVAENLSAESARRGQTFTPPGGELFYRSFITAFLDAMSAENKSLAAFAEQLRTTWPYLDLEEDR
jgi:hypothetical protein